nr:ABC transporter substrate-binding protein SapA [Bowmanella sp. JS7-9]
MIRNDKSGAYTPLFCLVIVLFSLAGCSEYRRTGVSESGVVYCSEGDPSTFNPQLDASGTTVDATSHQLYDRLLEINPKSNDLVPALATSWLVRDDGKTYVFQLRRDVQFHTTAYFTPQRSLNADDVIFSIDRWRLVGHPYHQVNGGEYPYFASLGLAQLIKEVRRINGYRIEIELNRPDSSFLANMATNFAVVQSAEYAEHLLAAGTPELIDTQPVGTGPYKFESFRKGSYIRYRRHEQYWGGDVAIDPLIYSITPRSSMRIAKLITGECDAIAYPAHSELQILEQRQNIVLDEKPGLNVGFWAFNTIKPPFDDARVRRALALAIDKDTLINAVYFGSAERAKGLLPPTSWAYQSSQRDISYNPVLARQLLDEAGIPKGFSMDVWAMPVERAYNPNARRMAELIQGYLQAIDINVNIVSFEWSTFRRKLQEGTHDSVLIGWSADSGDPDNFYRPLLSCSAIFSGTNRANWCNEEFDKLIDQALQYTDFEQRKLFYHMANNIISDDMPLVPIAHAFRYQAYQSQLQNFELNPYGGVSFVGVSKK